MKKRTTENTMVAIRAGILLVIVGLVLLNSKAEAQEYAEYQFWKSVGEAAAVQALDNMNIRYPHRGVTSLR